MAHIAEQAAAFLLGDGWKYQPCGDQYEKVIVGWAPAGVALRLPVVRRA